MSLPLVASFELPVADQLITPGQLMGSLDGSTSGASTHLSLPALPPFTQLAQETDLNAAPQTWLVPLDPGQTTLATAPGRAGELAVSELAGYETEHEADVLAPTANMKKLFKMTTSPAPVSLVVHRVGQTLVLDGGIDPFSVPIDGAGSPDGAAAPVPPKKSRTAASERALFSRFMSHQLVNANGMRGSAGVHEAQTFEDPATPLPGSSKFTRTFAFRLRDQNLVLGSDLLVFSSPGHPAISLQLHSIEEEVTQSTTLDYWLDNVLADVPELCICYHKQGYVQGYQVVSTAEIPYLGGRHATRTEPAFHPAAVEESAASILEFLRNNTRDSGSYWLYKGRSESSLRLYDLSAAAHNTAAPPVGRREGHAQPAPPFAFAVAMLCYRLGYKLLASQAGASTEPYAARVLRARSLFGRALDMLDKHKRPEVYFAVARKLAESYVAEHRAGPPHARMVAKTAVNADPTSCDGGSSAPVIVPGRNGCAGATLVRSVGLEADALEVEAYLCAAALLRATLPLVVGPEASTTHLVDKAHLAGEGLALLGEVHVYLALSAVSHSRPHAALRHTVHALTAAALAADECGCASSGSGATTSASVSRLAALVHCIALQTLGDVVGAAAGIERGLAHLAAGGGAVVDAALAPTAMLGAGTGGSVGEGMMAALEEDEAGQVEAIGVAAALRLFASSPGRVRAAHERVRNAVHPVIASAGNVGGSVALYEAMLAPCRAAVACMDGDEGPVSRSVRARAGALHNLIGGAFLEEHRFTKAHAAFAAASKWFEDGGSSGPDRSVNLASVSANVGRAYRVQAHQHAGNAFGTVEEALHARAVGAYLRASKILAGAGLEATSMFRDVNASLGGAYLSLALRLISVSPAYSGGDVDEAVRQVAKRLECAQQAYEMAGMARRVALVRMHTARLFALALGEWGAGGGRHKVELARRQFAGAREAAGASKSYGLLVSLAAMQVELDGKLQSSGSTPLLKQGGSVAAMCEAAGILASPHEAEDVDVATRTVFLNVVRAWLKHRVKSSGENSNAKWKALYRAALFLAVGAPASECGVVEAEAGCAAWREFVCML